MDLPGCQGGRARGRGVAVRAGSRIIQRLFSRRRAFRFGTETETADAPALPRRFLPGLSPCPRPGAGRAARPGAGRDRGASGRDAGRLLDPGSGLVERPRLGAARRRRPAPGVRGLPRGRDAARAGPAGAAPGAGRRAPRRGAGRRLVGGGPGAGVEMERARPAGGQAPQPRQLGGYGGSGAGHLHRAGCGLRHQPAPAVEPLRALPLRFERFVSGDKVENYRALPRAGSAQPSSTPRSGTHSFYVVPLRLRAFPRKKPGTAPEETSRMLGAGRRLALGRAHEPARWPLATLISEKARRREGTR